MVQGIVDQYAPIGPVPVACFPGQYALYQGHPRNCACGVKARYWPTTTWWWSAAGSLRAANARTWKANRLRQLVAI